VSPPRAIFAAALAFLLLPATGFAEPQEKVVFVAWNVRNYLLETSSEAGRTTPAKTPESVAAVVETLRELSPDILGLCEIGTRKDLADLQRRLRKSGVQLPHSTWVDGPDKQRHLALLSRFPLADVRHDTRTGFRLGGTPHRPQRGILDCTVEVRPHFRLRVLGVHFKSPRIVPDFDQADFRRAESLVLRRRVGEILGRAPETPLLVFGDFNDAKNSPVVRGVLGRAGTGTSLDIIPLADRQGDQWTYRWEESDEYTRVDFVMASRALRPLVTRGGSRIHRDRQWYLASDHRPLVVTLRLPAPPAR
jgi:endonuclease/exonuclease/phosphatase family metal-dependent hydrolase